jgi:hypothetical protein
MNKLEQEKNYRVYLHRKEWGELTDIEKTLFEWFEKNLNGDASVSALLAVDLYEEVLREVLQKEREEAVREFIDFCTANSSPLKELRGMLQTLAHVFMGFAGGLGND